MLFLRRIWTTIAGVVGDDAYALYCAHTRRRHPEQKLMTAREFYVASLERRYRRPSRCC